MILKRLAVIIFAYFLAAAATGIVVASFHFVYPTYFSNLQNSKLLEFVQISGGFSLIIAVHASALALWVIVLAEGLAIRTVIYFAIAGALIGLLLGWGVALKPWFPEVGFGQGLVAGAIYWWVAGRHSGPLENKTLFLGIVSTLAVGASFWLFPVYWELPGLTQLFR